MLGTFLIFVGLFPSLISQHDAVFRFILPNPFLPVCSSTDSAESLLSLSSYSKQSIYYSFGFWSLSKESTFPFPTAKGDFRGLLLW